MEKKRGIWGTSGRNALWSRLVKLSLLDPYLYMKLRDLITRDRRTVRNIESSGVFPIQTTRYFIDPVEIADNRGNWFGRACNSTQGADLVFLDPNIGIQPMSDRIPGPGHVGFYELSQLTSGNQSVVAYQHLRDTEPDINRMLFLQEKIHRPMRKLHWGGRYFLVIPSERHRDWLWNRLDTFEEFWNIA